MATAIRLEQATVDALDAMVTRGRFTSHDEAIRTALHLVEERDAAAAPHDAEELAWLEQRIAEADADPHGGIPAEEVFAELRQRYKHWE
jgi:Arc/MetJ-type ribon-helix-helix transcriptional regulator